MSSPYHIDNDGIGSGPFLTFSIDATTDLGFSQADIDDNKTACVISASNEVGKGSDTDKLFGKVVWVSSELVSGSTLPVSCAVQARGVARFKYRGDPPAVNQMVEVAGTGEVQVATAAASIAEGGHLHRGQVIAVDTTAHTCDVWLG